MQPLLGALIQPVGTSLLKRNRLQVRGERFVPWLTKADSQTQDDASR
jgi:hypothetical protein